MSDYDGRDPGGDQNRTVAYMLSGVRALASRGVRFGERSVFSLGELEQLGEQEESSCRSCPNRLNKCPGPDNCIYVRQGFEFHGM